MFKLPPSEVTIQPDTLFMIGDFPFTNSFAAGLLITLITILVALYVTFFVRGNKKPSKFDSFIEVIYMGFYDFIVQLAGGNKKAASKLLPIIGTIFLYIGISNTILILPGISSLKYNGITMFRSHTLDFNTTFAIAGIMVVMMNLYSLFKLNPIGFFFKYIKINSVFNGFRKGIGPGLLSLVDLFIGALDIISEFAKMISWSLRLFGNMYAGELLTGLVLSSLAIGAPVPLLLVFGLFSGLVQALVFGSLTAANFAMLMEDES